MRFPPECPPLHLAPEEFALLQFQAVSPQAQCCESFQVPVAPHLPFDGELTNGLGYLVHAATFWTWILLSWTIFLQPALLQNMKSVYKLDSTSITSQYAFKILQQKHSFKVKGAWPASSHGSVWVKLLHRVKLKQLSLYSGQWLENAAGGLNSLQAHIPME